jgi:hypothetical protein
MLSASIMLSASSAAVAFTTGGKAFVRKLPGATSPFGFFDPLDLAPESVEGVKLFREAELTHGRVAMMAAAGFLVQESFHPLFPGIGGPAINQLGQCNLATGLALLTPIFISEIFRATKGWVEPNFSTPETKARTIRKLREGYKPGDLGLDLTGNKPKGTWADATTGPWAEWQNKELNNGRLAMIAVAGMVGQELATGSGIFGA